MRWALALGLLVAGCGPPVDDGATRPSVVLVMVDQLRADSADAWMPATRRLAERGVIFEQMRAAAPWTYPSVVSLMSGLYPQQHGATGHLRRNLLTTFDRALPLLPARLREAGFHTAGFVANPFFQRFNPFHEGFDHFDVSFVGDRGNRRAGRHVWSERMFANTVDAAVRAHFEARAARGPEFVYVHYIDVHGPWEGAPFPAGYEPAVRFIDERVAALYRFFHERYRGDLLFLVTSDHGQELGDDLELGDGPSLRVRKKSLHDFNLRIPLWILPGRPVGSARRLAISCSNVDVVPTLLDWLDLDWPGPLAGVSLLPALRGESGPAAERALYARNDAFGVWSDAVVREGRKHLRYFSPDRDPDFEPNADPEGGRPVTARSYDLEADPRETRDLPEQHAEGERLLGRAAGTGGVEYPSRFEATDPALLERLRALGYMRGEEGAAEP